MSIDKLKGTPLLLVILLAFLATAFAPVETFKPITVISTNARIPLILIPGLTGSRMENDPNQDGVFGEVWPNGDRLVLDPWDYSLLALKLAPNGADPFLPEPQYATVRLGDIIRDEYGLDYYASTIAYFTGPNQGYVEGKDFFVCPYDWRKDLQEIAFGSLPQTLDKCIGTALSKNPGAAQVNLLAHSMGGLVSRVYLSDPLRATKVKRLVTLGTPFLGAPKIVLALIDRLCFAEWIGLCFSNPDVLHELIQNYPAGYQIAPAEAYYQVYPDGYIRRDRDADGDGQNDGHLNATSAHRLLAEHNPDLTRKAHELSNQMGAWSNGGTNGTEVFAVVGDRHATIGTIVEYEFRPWYNPWGPATIAYRSEATNGDGTVPLHSADMRDPDHQVNLSGGVSTIYYNLDHGQLPQDPAVLQLAASIFSSASPVSVNDLLQTAQDSLPTTSSPQAAAVPRAEPLPLEGQWLTISGPVQVEILDSVGNRTGRAGEQGQVENAIPGAGYNELGSTFFIFLPQAGRFELHLWGQEHGTADINIQVIAADQVVQTRVYLDLPVEENSQAVLLMDLSNPSADQLSLDQDGDGQAEGAFGPTAVLDAQESLDTTAPMTAITLQGAQPPGEDAPGPVVVTLSAADDDQGAGVAKIEYSLDGGRSVQHYTGPFQVDPQTVTWIIARATDRAGNEEPAFAYAQVGLVKLYLPGVIK